MSESSKPPDPVTQLADMQQQLLAAWLNPWKSTWGAAPPLPFRFEPIDPLVQEITLLAMMHNMASMLQSPQEIKKRLSVELVERAKKLGERT